jgi:O-antigen ligase
MLVMYRMQRTLFWWMIAIAGFIVVIRADSVVDRIYRPNFYAGGQMQWGTRTLGDRAPGMFENDRTRMLIAAVRYAEAFPLGIGPGNYRMVNQYYGRKDVWNTTQFTSAHGTLAQTLSETGWAGLIALITMIAAILRSLWKRASDDFMVTGIAAGCTAIALASFLGDYLFPTYHNDGLAHFGSTVVFWLAAGVGLAMPSRTVMETEA